MARLLAGVVVAAAGSLASADVIWDTGVPNPITNAGTVQYVGYSSGLVSPTTPQRWAAQAFSVPAGYNTITQIDADWFVVAGNEGATVNFGIFPRTSTATAPVSGSEVATGVLGAYAAGVDDPRVSGTDDWLHQYTGLSIAIAPGDYWLTIYADGFAPGNVSGLNNAAWLTGAPGVDPSVTYNNFMWRSSTYPSPGFVQYNPAALTPGPGMTDPTDVWNTSFAIYAVPAPGGLALLGLGGLSVTRRRRR